MPLFGCIFGWPRHLSSGYTSQILTGAFSPTPRAAARTTISTLPLCRLTCLIGHNSCALAIQNDVVYDLKASRSQTTRHSLICPCRGDVKATDRVDWGGEYRQGTIPGREIPALRKGLADSSAGDATRWERDAGAAQLGRYYRTSTLTEKLLAIFPMCSVELESDLTTGNGDATGRCSPVSTAIPPSASATGNAHVSGTSS
ncbi:hypothetical protein K438DRAFT_1941779 [Mycena galopus ATCC 62051]|nr:hypothetical protein K438DRAFT_1941779 [Mycena galopus ATCC 62051]